MGQLLVERAQVGQLEVSEWPLRVELHLQATDACWSWLDVADAHIQDVSRFVFDGTCHADVTVVPADGETPQRVHVRSPVQSTCICPVFVSQGAVPQITEVRGDAVEVVTFLSDHASLRRLVDRLAARDVAVQIRRITTEDGIDADDYVTLDLSGLTEKQREAVELGVREGYYEQPRRVSHQELADRFGISKSALSQRLTGAEGKIIVRAFVETAGESATAD